MYILFSSILPSTKIKPHKTLALIIYAFMQDKSKPSLSFNPGLALTAFRTTGPGLVLIGFRTTRPCCLINRPFAVITGHVYMIRHTGQLWNAVVFKIEQFHPIKCGLPLF